MDHSRSDSENDGTTMIETKDKIVDSDDSDKLMANVYEIDASNGLSYQKLMHVLDTKHARRDVYVKGRHETEKRPICGTKTGRASCDKETRKSDLENYGVGLVVYFQFVKYMSCLYFWLAVLSLPAMILFWAGNKSKVADLNELITVTSLGNIGESPIACGEGKFSAKE